MREALQNHLELLMCPSTGAPLRREGNRLHSSEGISYSISGDGKICFVATETMRQAKESRELFDRLKASLKSLMGKFYPLLVDIVSPVLPRMHWGSMTVFWKHLLYREMALSGDRVIQLGSGNDRISPRIVNIDLFAFPEVDVVADCTRLPYKSGTLDGAISSAVFEHIENPEKVMAEIHRVLKPGGFILTGVPFMQGYHGSPSDFTRWTTLGLRVFHEKHGFVNNEIHVIAGPTSSLLWVAQEWLAIVLSLGIRPLYYFWFLLLLSITWPLKLLDVLLVYHPMAWRIASFSTCIGYKPK